MVKADLGLLLGFQEEEGDGKTSRMFSPLQDCLQVLAVGATHPPPLVGLTVLPEAWPLAYRAGWFIWRVISDLEPLEWRFQSFLE